MAQYSWRNYLRGTIFHILLLLFFYSWQGASEIAVHQSNLAEVKCFTAIMSMSGAQKTNWWHFLPYLEANDEAFVAYLVSNFTNGSGATCDFQSEVEEKGRLLATRNAAIAEYSSTEKIESLGRMEITMWALGFACLDASTRCDRFTPVVLKQVGDKTAFFSVWEQDEPSGNITNSITARVLELPTKVVRTNVSEVSLRVLVNSRNSELPDLCKGLSLPDEIVSNTTILLDSTNFSSGLDVKVAAEAAGFHQMSKAPSFCSPAKKKKPGLCLMGIETTSTGEDSDTSKTPLDVTSAQYPILLSFMSHVKNSYIKSQNSALELKYPGTDFWVAAIALPSALIAVFAAAVPFINVQLRAFRGLRTSQRFKVFVLCICNTILSGISYSAAVALVPAELERQKSFITWGLLADQIPINRRLQVLVVVQGKSAFFSYSLLVVMLSLAFLLPVVVCITIHRCKQVFRRLKLLKDLRELDSDGEDEDSEALEEQTHLDDLQAIEMTNVEEHLLVKKLAKLRSLRRRDSFRQQVSPPGGRLRSFSVVLSRNRLGSSNT